MTGRAVQSNVDRNMCRVHLEKGEARKYFKQEGNPGTPKIRKTKQTRTEIVKSLGNCTRTQQLKR